MAVEGITIRRLQDPTAPELEQVAAIVSEALFDGTIAQMGCGGDRELFRRLHRAVSAGTAVGGHLLAAIDDRTGEVVGTISFFGPGKTIIGDEEQRAQGYNDVVASMPPELRPFFTETAAEALAEIDQLVGPGGKEQSWSAHSFAVRKDYRGHGIGKSLLAAGEALAKADRVPVMFETEHLHNVHMYKHLGYKAVRVMHLQSLGGREFTLFRKDFLE